MAAKIKPLKKYGQNFLRNDHLAEQIVAALDCGGEDTVLEIGAGEGVLTEKLIKAACKSIIAVEIDKRLANHLRNKYDGMVEILEDDFLKISLGARAGGAKLKILGNIPYYLTSDIIFKILEHATQIERAVLMVQKEVAERLVADPGNKNYGILSVFTKSKAIPTLLFSVGRENFYPVPAVDSAVIRLEFTNTITSKIIDYELFKEIIYRSFSTRRKMLRNSLKELLARRGIEHIRSADLAHRPEDLTVDQFVCLANEMIVNTDN